MFVGSTLHKMAARVNPAILSRAMTSTNLCRLTALCKANSAVLSQTISVIDSLLKKNHVDGANKVFQKECLETTVGKQFRHSLDHLEKVALDGLSVVRDDGKPIDLHYDVRDRGTLCERDVCEARDRALFIQNIFDGLRVSAEQEGDTLCSTDGARHLTAYFALPGSSVEEIPLNSTLEREMGFACHHAIHHCALVKAIAAIGRTGLTLDDLPPEFGRAPMVSDNNDDDAAA